MKKQHLYLIIALILVFAFSLTGFIVLRYYSPAQNVVNPGESNQSSQAEHPSNTSKVKNIDIEEAKKSMYKCSLYMAEGVTESLTEIAGVYSEDKEKSDEILDLWFLSLENLDENPEDNELKKKYAGELLKLCAQIGRLEYISRLQEYLDLPQAASDLYGYGHDQAAINLVNQIEDKYARAELLIKFANQSLARSNAKEIVPRYIHEVLQIFEPEKIGEMYDSKVSEPDSKVPDPLEGQAPEYKEIPSDIYRYENMIQQCALLYIAIGDEEKAYEIIHQVNEPFIRNRLILHVVLDSALNYENAQTSLVEEAGSILEELTTNSDKFNYGISIDSRDITLYTKAGMLDKAYAILQEIISDRNLYADTLDRMNGIYLNQLIDVYDGYLKKQDIAMANKVYDDIYEYIYKHVAEEEYSPWVINTITAGARKFVREGRIEDADNIFKVVQNRGTETAKKLNEYESKVLDYFMVEYELAVVHELIEMGKLNEALIRYGECLSKALEIEDFEIRNFEIYSPTLLLDKFEQTGNPEVIREAYDSLNAAILNAIGRETMALRYARNGFYDEALSYIKDIDVSEMDRVVLGDLLELSIRQGLRDISEAVIDLFYRQNSSAEASHEKVIENMKIAGLYDTIGDHERCREIVEESWSIFSGLDNRYKVKSSVALAYIARGWEKAGLEIDEEVEKVLIELVSN